MTHQEMQDLYELYALGLLEPGERAEVDQHLRTGCKTCEGALRRAALTNSAILSFAPDVEPPKTLRKRVLAGFGVDRTHWGWVAGWSALTAGLLIATLWFSMDSHRAHEELAAAREQVTRASVQAGRSATELARVQAALDFFNQPDTRQVMFGKGSAQPPRGTVLVNPRNGVVLIASNLPWLESGKAFEMWLVPRNGPPKPAGLFKADAGASALHVAPGPVDPTTTAVAVSVEPETGSAAPTTEPFIVTPISR